MVDTLGCVVVVTVAFPGFPLASWEALFLLLSFPDFLFHLDGAKGVGLGYMVLHCMHGRVSALGSRSFFSSCFPFGIVADMVDRGLHSGNTTNRNRNRTTERRGITRWLGWAPGITATYLDLQGGKRR